MSLRSYLTLSACLSVYPANKEYYHQWSVEECHGCSLDLSAFTIEELDNITSEYTLKNTVSSHGLSLKPHTGLTDPYVYALRLIDT